MGKNVVKGTTVDGAAISLPARSTIRAVTLSERLQWILEHRKISASALSLKAGQSRAYVRKLIEREPTRPDFTALERIAAVAEVPSLWLIRGQGGPTEGADAPRELTLEREDSRVPEDDEVPLETALFQVFAAAPRGRYATADFDAARAAIRGSHRKALPDGDQATHAEQLLDAARALRLLDVPATVQNVLTRALDDPPALLAAFPLVPPAWVLLRCAWVLGRSVAVHLSGRRVWMPEDHVGATEVSLWELSIVRLARLTGKRQRAMGAEALPVGERGVDGVLVIFAPENDGW